MKVLELKTFKFRDKQKCNPDFLLIYLLAIKCLNNCIIWQIHVAQVCEFVILNEDKTSRMDQNCRNYGVFIIKIHTCIKR